MYSAAVTRPVAAHRYPTVPDPAPEGELPSHAFESEAALSGSELGASGYPVDEVKSGTDACLDCSRGAAERVEAALWEDDEAWVSSESAL